MKVVLFRANEALGGLSMREEFAGRRASTSTRSESQSSAEHPSKFNISSFGQTHSWPPEGVARP